MGQARTLKQDLVRGIDELRSAVKTQLKELDDIHVGARNEWRKLAATMQTKRGGVAVEVKAAPVAPPLVEMKPPEAVAPPPVEEVEEDVAETHAVIDMVFEYLASHPDGVKVFELEEEFGLGRKKAEKALKRLMKDGKVEKVDDLYFAV